MIEVKEVVGHVSDELMIKDEEIEAISMEDLERECSSDKDKYIFAKKRVDRIAEKVNNIGRKLSNLISCKEISFSEASKMINSYLNSLKITSEIYGILAKEEKCFKNTED